MYWGYKYEWGSPCEEERYVNSYSRAGYLNYSMSGIWGQRIICCEDCPVHAGCQWCPCPHFLNASCVIPSNRCTSKRISTHCPMSSGGTITPSWEPPQYCDRHGKEKKKRPWWELRVGSPNPALAVRGGFLEEVNPRIDLQGHRPLVESLEEEGWEGKCSEGGDSWAWRPERKPWALCSSEWWATLLEHNLVSPQEAEIQVFSFWKLCRWLPPGEEECQCGDYGLLVSVQKGKMPMASNHLRTEFSIEVEFWLNQLPFLAQTCIFD